MPRKSEHEAAEQVGEPSPIKTSVQFPPALLIAIDARARKARRSRSAEVVTLVEAALDAERKAS